MKRQGIKAIEKGDVVLFYTGWLKLLGKDNKRFGSAAPVSAATARGISRRLKWRWSVPTHGTFKRFHSKRTPAYFEVHQILIPLNGIHILENINTEEMVGIRPGNFCYRGAARITGAVQSIVNPVAIK